MRWQVSLLNAKMKKKKQIKIRIEIMIAITKEDRPIRHRIEERKKEKRNQYRKHKIENLKSNFVCLCLRF